MKQLVFLVFIIFSFHNFFSQENGNQNNNTVPFYQVSSAQSNQLRFVANKIASVTFSNITTDFAPALLIKEMPKQSAQKVIHYNYPQQKNEQAANTASYTLPALIKGLSFKANPFSANTPNDNDMAISDSGFVVSVINSSFYVKDTRNISSSPYFKSLSVFTGSINNGMTCFDPKVMYDPKMDRFVFCCLAGFVDSTSRVILGFSKTSIPSGAWNFYYLPGNPLNNHLWTDYPMIAMTDKELFLTVNLLTNNSSWQTGFVQSIVWQMKKDSGYAGLPLPSVLHTNINYNGAPIRNLCPVKGGSKLYSPNMYFLSNRNFASQNDSIFLVNVTNSISANNTVTVKMIKTNQSYYFPPDGRQPISTESLATNDARNLGAFYENNKIQYVHNTNNPVNNHVSVYYGIIDSPTAINPTVTGYIIPNDTMDFGYPNISYAGNSSTDDLAIISFNHSSDKVYPGCSAIESDAKGNFSPILRIINGTTYVNLLTSNLERWGDYSGSQRRYSVPDGEVWLGGYYASSGGNYPNAHAAWLAQITSDRNLNLVGVKKNTTTKDENFVNIFPNPSAEFFSVELNLTKPEYLSFDLLDASGKKIQPLIKDWVKVNQTSFSFNIHDLNKGIYYLKISGTSTNITKTVIKN